MKRSTPDMCRFRALRILGIQRVSFSMLHGNAQIVFANSEAEQCMIVAPISQWLGVLDNLFNKNSERKSAYN